MAYTRYSIYAVARKNLIYRLALFLSGLTLENLADYGTEQEQQRVAVGRGNTQFNSIRQVSSDVATPRRGTCGHCCMALTARVVHSMQRFKELKLKTGATRALVSNVNKQRQQQNPDVAAVDRQTSLALAGAFSKYNVELRTGRSLFRDAHCADNTEFTRKFS